MTIAELIASREPDWRELEELTRELHKPLFRSRTSPEKIARFSSLYRAACSDLALAESYQLPPATSACLNELVAVAHNALYRRRGGRKIRFSDIVFFETPGWILTDVTFWIALLIFWGCFLTSLYLGKSDVSFANDLLGPGAVESVVRMYDEEFDDDLIERLPMAAFYISHNGGIGLKCFAFGILGAFPGAFILLSNAIQLGAIYGYMAGPEAPLAASRRFFEFTLAHGPFELTAITLSAAAGMRMGLGIVMTRGYTRLESLRRATMKASPTIFVAFLFFCVAAMIEAFVSPNPMKWLEGTFLSPVLVKSAVFWLSTAALLVYFFGLGGVAILRRYRSETFRNAFRSFWNAALDFQSDRISIDGNSSSSEVASRQ